jgi:Arc/MetJ-type ribon-helix-helix transcriptional regulator
MTTLIQAEIPDQLAQQARRLVERGWAASVDSLVAESLRRYLESHQEGLAEQLIRRGLGTEGKWLSLHLTTMTPSGSSLPMQDR